MKTTTKEIQMKRKMTERTTAGLCDALFEEFDLLRNGDSDSSRAGAIAKLSIQIINTKRLEIDTASMLKGGLNISSVIFDGKKMNMGSAKK